MKKALKITVLIIAIFIFIFSAYMIASNLLKYKKSSDTYNSISSNAVTLSSSFVLPELDSIGSAALSDTEKNDAGIAKIVVKKDEEAEKATPIEVDEEYIEEYNPDIIGWIYCPDTNINYPVLQSDDNNYYLRRMANKKYNIAGSIFMDYRNKGDFSDINTIIYGHNMKNGSMFSDIMKYQKKSYFQQHQYIYYTSDERDYVFKVIGSAVVSPDDPIFNTFYEPIDMQRQLETYPSMLLDDTIDISTIEHLVTLSTCSNDEGTMRYLLFCIPIEIIKE